MPGSILLPLSEFSERYEELPKDKNIIMQCRSGARSARIYRYITRKGLSSS